MRSVTGEIITVLVGKRTFYVHQALLASSSQFFRNVMKPEWRTDRTKPIDLTDANPQLFTVYSQWLYTKQVAPSTEKKIDIRLAKLYVLGERVMDEDFQNCILDAMAARFQITQPSIGTIRTIYEGTAATSPARRLVVDMSAFFIKTPEARRVQDLDPDSDGEFMMDFIAALIKYRAQPSCKVAKPWITERHLYRVGTASEEQHASAMDV